MPYDRRAQLRHHHMSAMSHASSLELYLHQPPVMARAARTLADTWTRDELAAALATRRTHLVGEKEFVREHPNTKKYRLQWVQMQVALLAAAVNVSDRLGFPAVI